MRWQPLARFLLTRALIALTVTTMTAGMVLATNKASASLSSSTDNDGFAALTPLPVAVTPPVASTVGVAPMRQKHLLRYGAHPRQTVELRWNAQATTQPLVVVVHGGHWSSGSRETPEMARLVTLLGKAGYATATPHYRFTFQAHWPAPRDDIEAAVTLLVERAADLRLDPSRVFLIGSSAGGHLALSAATLGSNSRYRAVVALSAPTDPALAVTLGRRATHPSARKLAENAQRLVGCPLPTVDPLLLGQPVEGSDLCAQRWRDANVAHHASPADPATLLIHAQDDFVNPLHSLQLAAALQRNAVAVTTRLTSGRAHGFELLDQPGITEEVLGFLNGFR